MMLPRAKKFEEQYKTPEEQENATSDSHDAVPMFYCCDCGTNLGYRCIDEIIDTCQSCGTEQYVNMTAYHKKLETYASATYKVALNSECACMVLLATCPDDTDTCNPKLQGYCAQCEKATDKAIAIAGLEGQK